MAAEHSGHCCRRKSRDTPASPMNEAVEGDRCLINSVLDEVIERIEKIKMRPEDNKN